MPRAPREVDPIPKQFPSAEAAAEFWAAHDTTDYPDAFADVAIDVDWHGRRFGIDIDADVMTLLCQEARRRHTRPGSLASRLLRRSLASPAT